MRANNYTQLDGLYQIPIGNTFQMKVILSVNGEPDDISLAEKKSVKVSRLRGLGVIHPTDVIWGNGSVSLTISGKNQIFCDTYKVIVTYDQPANSQDGDAIQRQFSLQAFRLVSDLDMQSGSSCNDIEIPLLELNGCVQFGKDGKDGDAGKSAYQSALDGGFVGTEMEFNTSLASIGDISAVLDMINGEVI